MSPQDLILGAIVGAPALALGGFGLLLIVAQLLGPPE